MLHLQMRLLLSLAQLLAQLLHQLLLSLLSRLRQRQLRLCPPAAAQPRCRLSHLLRR